MKKHILQSMGLALATATGTAAYAQAVTTPLQETKPAEPPAANRVTMPRFEQPASGLPAGGGVSVTLQEVLISGNASIPTATLLARLGPVQGKALDMRGLTELANTVGQAYREAGFIFAQAYLPPQDLATGKLQINVVEGQYGAVRTLGKDGLDQQGQPFLAYGLKAGDVIQNQQLERTLLIMDDLPGIKVQPVLRPGTAQGTADLLVNVNRDETEESGSIGLDNIGPRSTGEYRLRGTAHLNNKLRFGDKISLSGLVTDKNMWLGSVDYDTPLGYSGLRGTVGLAHSSYQLGGDFASLGAHGIADTFSLGLSHPVIRSQASNLYLSLGLQHKELKDIYDASSTTRHKRSNATLMGARFDNRDRFGGGGITYGSVTLALGRLTLDANAAASDAVTAQTYGSYTKLNLDIARIQSLPARFSLYGRFSGQWANQNLDASEKFNLGGFYGVRAHPLGEGTGDKGYLWQAEVRYAVDEALTPFAFYDAGHSKSNITPWDTGSAATRTVTGYGVGVRSILGAWSLDATLATQGRGGASTSDNVNRNPRLFVMAGRRF